MYYLFIENRFGSSNFIYMCIEMIVVEVSKVNNIGFCYCVVGS